MTHARIHYCRAAVHKSMAHLKSDGDGHGVFNVGPDLCERVGRKAKPFGGSQCEERRYCEIPARLEARARKAVV